MDELETTKKPEVKSKKMSRKAKIIFISVGVIAFNVLVGVFIYLDSTAERVARIAAMESYSKQEAFKDSAKRRLTDAVQSRKQYEMMVDTQDRGPASSKKAIRTSLR